MKEYTVQKGSHDFKPNDQCFFNEKKLTVMRLLVVCFILSICGCHFPESAYLSVPGEVYAAKFIHNGRNYSMLSDNDRWPSYYIGDSLAMTLHISLPEGVRGQMYPHLDTLEDVHFYPEFHKSSNSGVILLDGQQFLEITVLDGGEIWFSCFFNAIPDPCGFGTDYPDCINLFTEGKLTIPEN